MTSSTYLSHDDDPSSSLSLTTTRVINPREIRISGCGADERTSAVELVQLYACCAVAMLNRSTSGPSSPADDKSQPGGPVLEVHLYLPLGTFRTELLQRNDLLGLAASGTTSWLNEIPRSLLQVHWLPVFGGEGGDETP